MEISVDISLYPLQGEYLEPIRAFISAMENEPNVDVVCNELSTQMHGDYHTIMKFLEREVFAVFEEVPHSVFTIKMVGNNRKGML